MDLVPYAVPFFLLAILLELAWGRRTGRNTYRINDAVGSLFMGSLSTTIKLVFIGAGGLVFVAIERKYSLWRMDTGSPWTWVFAWFAYDFCYYWFHRISHERQILWAAHVAHHQSEDYNLSTALRQTSSGALLGWIFYIPLFLVGVPAQVYVTVASANLIYQFWVHTEHVPKLGFLEWFMITPSNHRVHHAQNDLYVDRNYGGVFLIWDRLFGTFQEELEGQPCIYGIRGPLRSFDPLWANLHIYTGMFTDMWRAARWRDKLWIPLSRTGWRPVDVVEQYPRAKTDLNDFHKYDPEVAAQVKAYALAQLLIVLGAGLVVLSIPEVAARHALIVTVVMALSMVCTTRWLDGHASAPALDGLRLAGLLVLSLLAWQAAMSPLLVAPLLAYTLLNAAALPYLQQRYSPRPRSL